MFETRKSHFFVLVAVALLAAVGNASAISIASGTSDENYRFDTNRGGATFVADGFDLSGVGVTDTGELWATLLSRNVVISAFHYRPDSTNGQNPPYDNPVTFYSSNDASGLSHTSTISNAIRLSGSDIFLGVLDNPVPETGYASYEFITEDITTEAQYNNSSLRYEPDPPGPQTGNEVNAYMFGNREVGTRGSANQWVGRNIIDRFLNDFENNFYYGTNTDDLIGLDDGLIDSGSAPPVTYESILQGGDSGAPLFIDDNGNFLLTGIARTIYGADGVPFGSGYSYLGNYDAEIQNYIESNPIPEPDALVLMIAGGLVMASRRRRHQ